MILNKNAKTLLFIASIMMALGIALGAFGAHALKEILSTELLKVYETGIKYHFFNTLGLFAIAIILTLKQNTKPLFICGILVFIGTLLFSLSLYFMVVFNAFWLGIITPIGGSLLIITWLLVAYYSIKD